MFICIVEVLKFLALVITNCSAMRHNSFICLTEGWGEGGGKEVFICEPFRKIHLKKKGRRRIDDFASHCKKTLSVLSVVSDMLGRIVGINMGRRSSLDRAADKLGQ